MSSQKTGSKPWGQPREVPVSALTASMQRGRWIALYDDILLRLQKTGSGHALEYPFADSDEGYLAAGAVKRFADTNLGKEAVLVNTMSDGNGGRLLYVRRGPKWQS